jgi:hypothetical protein
MTLEHWARMSCLQPSRPTPQEVGRLFQVVARDLSDASSTSISSDARFMSAYSAAEALCRIALLASGYQVQKGQSQHHHSIESLPLTLGSHHAGDVHYLTACRRKRHQGIYEQVGVASVKDAEDLVVFAMRLRGEVEEWLVRQHPTLAPPKPPPG